MTAWQTLVEWTRSKRKMLLIAGKAQRVWNAHWTLKTCRTYVSSSCTLLDVVRRNAWVKLYEKNSFSVARSSNISLISYCRPNLQIWTGSYEKRNGTAMIRYWYYSYSPWRQRMRPLNLLKQHIMEPYCSESVYFLRQNLAISTNTASKRSTLKQNRG